MMFILSCALMVLTSLTLDTAHAQLRMTWPRTPTVVVGSPGDDPRLPLVDEAVSFWNKTLKDVGSGFRLGPVRRLVQPIPERRCSR